ncbi:TPA: hypothetical protein QFB99_000808 [Enterococcus faecium]
MLGVIILPFIAILFDLVAAAAYFLQYNRQSSEVLFVGMIFQGVITLLLLIMIISYKGKKYARVQTEIFVKYVSIRYGIIILSFLMNAIVLFLYVLNYLNINPLIFSR